MSKKLKSQQNAKFRLWVLFLITCCNIWLSCTTIRKFVPKFDNFETTLRSYQISFFKDMDIKPNNYIHLSAGFSKLDSPIIGQCTTFGLARNEITVDPINWERYGPLEKTALMYHELGHCLCDLDHTYMVNYKYQENVYTGEGFYPDLCSKSLMAPEIQDTRCLMAHWDSYIEELKAQCHKK